MALPTRKNKHGTTSASALGYFSDLFAALTFIFLFLYIIASLQNNVLGITRQFQTDEMEKKYQEKYKSLVVEYESTIEAYRAQSASNEDNALYKKLMASVAVIEKKKKEEINERKRKIQEERNFIADSRKKISEINSIKAMMKNMIEANKSLVGRLSKAKNIAKEQHKMEKALMKKQYDAENEIMKATYKVKLKMQQKKLDKDKIKMISNMENMQLNQTKSYSKLESSKNQLAMAKKSEVEKLKRAKDRELAKINEARKAERDKLVQEKDDVQKARDKELAQINQARVAEREKLRREKEVAVAQVKESSQKEIQNFKRATAGELTRLEQQKKTLQKQYSSSLDKERMTSDAQKQRMQSEYDKKLKSYNHKINNLKNDKSNLQERVQDLNDREGIRKKIAESLRDAFVKNNVRAKVDPKTGEVIIQFDNAYFDFDSAVLKAEMKRLVNKIFPIFAKTILGNKGYSKHVASFELVGFSSPIYKGIIIKDSSSKVAKDALSYNMNLSYKRAKSIFDYIFRGSGANFNHRDSMLDITKVSSLSHIVSKLKKTRGLASTGAKETMNTPWSKDELKANGMKPIELSKGRQLCEEYNCNDWQKVAIRINLVE